MSQMIEISAIEVGERLRAVDPNHVAVIASSVRECGRILQPIAVSMVYREKALRPNYVLVAGAHRLAAAQLAGLSEIPAEVYEGLSSLAARLIEIDENLLRHELNPLDRAVFLAERKAVYEGLHPETKAGVAGAKARHDSANDTMSFAKDAAEKTGLNPRTIQRAVTIVSKISPEIRRSLTGTILSKNQKELLLLAKQPPEQQAEIVGLMLGENAPVKSVKAAIERVSGKVAAVPDRNEAQTRHLVNAWMHAGILARRAFVHELSEADRRLLRELLSVTEPNIEEAA
jgi:ParB family chromosome partitioning protein